MLGEIEKLKAEATASLNQIRTSDDAENFRLKYLSRKGSLAQLFEKLKDVPKDEKPAIGKLLNELRNALESEFESVRKKVEAEKSRQSSKVDLSIPGRRRYVGRKHPLTQTADEIKRIFISIGFGIADGPEIEDDYHNFEALNFPPDHPARDMQDTFFVKSETGKYVLRTHTSPVQIRVMENNKPPVRVIIPGRVYRNEAVSARSYCLFHQVEGLYVDKNVSLAELKGTISFFAKEFFGSDVKLRFRPSYFPFTEPSAEVDVSCFICGGKGCRICKYSGWLEVLGCGMVDPNVYKFVGYDENEVSGYAFGMGIERLALLRYGIDDIRLFFENDLRFLNQF
ncbi:MAG: phenylalanine--tRNA ligase subunit alpha [Bacteroidetes bacterium]|nr:phenylalanine--tRNA ligase subunit alpha [Bacteroidota bacterium]MCL5739105.1 phenylalanine--tRNA ligase subunit alpha [Bacteroidota bacterium]